MMTIVKNIILILCIFLSTSIYAGKKDTRIKFYTYDPDQVYLMYIHYGFQSHIEFAKNEEVQTVSLGELYAWRITPVNNLLFISALEKNINTNMTVITNKRIYHFDLISTDFHEGDEDNLVYAIKFTYPKHQQYKCE